jgi:hypothetical protein
VLKIWPVLGGQMFSVISGWWREWRLRRDVRSAPPRRTSHPGADGTARCRPGGTLWNYDKTDAALRRKLGLFRNAYETTEKPNG